MIRPAASNHTVIVVPARAPGGARISPVRGAPPGASHGGGPSPLIEPEGACAAINIGKGPGEAAMQNSVFMIFPGRRVQGAYGATTLGWCRSWTRHPLRSGGLSRRDGQD